MELTSKGPGMVFGFQIFKPNPDLEPLPPRGQGGAVSSEIIDCYSGLSAGSRPLVTGRP